MKRIQEKVKDLIEVRTQRNLPVLMQNPGEVLFSYHFTEFTSGMMAGWLDDLSATGHGNGHVRLVAGHRGTGKTHFLNALSAIVSQTEIRSRIPDSRIAASANLLRRRRYPVGSVKRGSGENFIGELRNAVAETLSVDPRTVGDSVGDILKTAGGRGGDLPFVLMIDSETERRAPVRKDDGDLISEVIRLASAHNIFVAVALDNDLAVNTGFSSPSGKVIVDFLDEESLCSVIDSQIFPKNRQKQRVLNAIFNEFRSVIPNFRWNEQKFTSLYPLHPATFEVAPSVRSYAPDFALLTFASEAGGRIVGRPADSLVALDEVFDYAEGSLRAAGALAEAFASYDRLGAEVVSQMPVMERLQAKLVLKALLLLSLEGAGATASDISSALMIYDGRDPQSGARLVANILERYAAHLPDHLLCTRVEGREARFRLKLGAREDFSKRLEALAAKIPDSAIPVALRKAASLRFDDLEDAGQSSVCSAAEIEWRGSLRRGKIYWSTDGADLSLEPESLADRAWDWAVVVRSAADESPAPEHDPSLPIAFWTHGALTDEDARTLKLYLALLEDNGLSAEFGDRYQSELHSLGRDSQGILEHCLISGGVFACAGVSTSLEDSHRESQGVSDLLSALLTPLLDARYPGHPSFDRCLRMAEVTSVAGDLFGGSRQSLPEVQALAEIFAEPLGLVSRRGQALGIESEGRILGLPVVRDIMNLVKSSEGGTVSLRDVSARLGRPPLGLVREAQFLVLAALVAVRKIEFVTARGNRIGRRALDLGIRWDDIVGIAGPELLSHPKEKLARWVQLLTGDRTIVSIDGDENQEAALKAVEIWLADWRSARLLDRYGELPDDILNDRTWRLYSNLERTFGSAAKTAEMAADRSMPLGEALNRIADVFADDERHVEQRRRDVSDLEEFILGASLREKIWKYLAICEPTGDADVEWCRKLLTKALDQSAANPTQEANVEIKALWETFHQIFTEHFAERHDAVMRSRDLKVRFEAVTNSDEWWEFESLARIPLFSQVHWREAQRIKRHARQLECRFDVRKMLEEHPFCACSYNQSTRRELALLPETMQAVVEAGRSGFRDVLAMLRDVISETVESLARNSWDDNFKASAASLISHLNAEGEIPLLGSGEISVLGKAIENMPASPVVSVGLPKTEFVSRRQLRSQVSAWLDNLPDQPVLLRV